MINNPKDVWTEELERAIDRVINESDFEKQGGTCIEAGENIRALAFRLSGVECIRCGGYGYYAYGSTSTWQGGIGGQMITNGVCDKCWGTGRSDKTGANLRKIRNDQPR